MSNPEVNALDAPPPGASSPPTLEQLRARVDTRLTALATHEQSVRETANKLGTEYRPLRVRIDQVRGYFDLQQPYVQRWIDEAASRSRADGTRIRDLGNAHRYQVRLERAHMDLIAEAWLQYRVLTGAQLEPWMNAIKTHGARQQAAVEELAQQISRREYRWRPTAPGKKSDGEADQR